MIKNKSKNKLVNLIIFLSIALILISFTGLSFGIENQENKSEFHILFFYSERCPHCEMVLNSNILEKVKNELESKYPVKIEIRKMIAWKNVELFNKLFYNYYHTTRGGVPFLVFYKNNMSDGFAILGDRPIIDNLKKFSEAYVSKYVEPYPTYLNKINNKLNISKLNMSMLNSSYVTLISNKYSNIWLLIIITALADSVNPCIMSILILLLSYLLMLRRKKDVIKYGLYYSIVVFITYFILGLLIYKGVNVMFKLIKLSSIGQILTFFIASLCIFAGIVNIKDFFAYGKGISFQLSKKHKRFVDKIIRKVSLITILILGIFITLVEFPCSGIMYLGIISYIASHNIPYSNFLVMLVIYNLIFILPLILIIIFTLIGKKIEEVEKMRMKFRKVFRLVMGIALLFIAYLLIRRAI